MNAPHAIRDSDVMDSRYSWFRLAVSLLFSTLGGVGLWSFVVALPAIQADFGVDRASASMPYTLLAVGFAIGAVPMGRLADRFGIHVPAALGTAMLGIGYIATGYTGTLWQFAIVHGVLIGIGASTTFAPMMADVSHWFVRRRGIAVSICAAGNYLAGTIWPPLVQHFIETSGWRTAHIGIGITCLVTMLPLVLLLRRRPPAHAAGAPEVASAADPRSLGLSPKGLQILLLFAGLTCCIAMSMPQVHIVAYCGDLGYGIARGAEMLSVMLAFGVVSRIGSGFIADRLGGAPTLLIGSVMQAVALGLYTLFDGIESLYIISALFGLFQGGIIPSYAIIIREYFSPKEAATRVGLVITATLVGMAFGGWMSGAIFDLTGSYRAAFVNGFLWNLANTAIAIWLVTRSVRPRLAAA